MTGVRASFVYCREQEFGKGKGDGDSWLAPPPGSFISLSHTRSTTKVYTAGSKYWDTLAYGQLSGSWEWTFLMDYDYIEPFLIAFEATTIDGNTFTLNKANNKRVRSFTFRRKQLNSITGGMDDNTLSDETIIYTGCVPKTLRMSKSGGSSQLSISISGFYANESLDKSTLSSTDYQEYNGNLTEFSCMFIGDVANKNYVANTESLNIAIENSAAAIYATCSAMARNYCEGQTSYSFGTTSYANDPAKYLQRMYSGGKNNTETKPRNKKMGPIKTIHLVSFDEEIDEHGDNIATAYNSSTRSLDFELTKTAIKSLTKQKGDGSKLQDQINSTECQKITMRIKTPAYSSLQLTDANIENIWGAGNPHALKG